jgi:8-oxo-dGTP pyrophosphatase MutT (NUDIX family)
MDDRRSTMLACKTLLSEAHMLTTALEAEIAALAARYGAPGRVSAELGGAPFDPLAMTDRIGEVCMVVRRPSGTLITAIKTFYPPGAFRLLTGGVGHGEPIEAALLREVAEETGLEVAVRRFLAVIEYHLAPTTDHRPPTAGEGGAYHVGDLVPGPNRQYDFATFAFLLDELGGTLAAHDPAERIGAFREVAVAELPAMAEALDHVGERYAEEIGGSWGDWGRFRAVVHRVVYQALAATEGAPYR